MYNDCLYVTMCCYSIRHMNFWSQATCFLSRIPNTNPEMNEISILELQTLNEKHIGSLAVWL